MSSEQTVIDGTCRQPPHSRVASGCERSSPSGQWPELRLILHALMRVPHRASRIPAANGFTLIEVLVLIVIVGVLATVVTLGASSIGGERKLEQEAQRFQAIVMHACERAELVGREIGVRIDAAGYAFATLAINGWMPDEQQGELRQRSWAPGIEAELLRDGRALRTQGANADGPVIVCFSSGEMSPFVLRLGLAGVATRYELRGAIDGRIAFTRLGESR